MKQSTRTRLFCGLIVLAAEAFYSAFVLGEWLGPLRTQDKFILITGFSGVMLFILVLVLRYVR